MTLLDKAKQYDMDPGKLREIITAEPKNRHFFEQRDLSGYLDSVSERAIDEIMAKRKKEQDKSDESPAATQPATDNFSDKMNVPEDVPAPATKSIHLPTAPSSFDGEKTEESVPSAEQNEAMDEQKGPVAAPEKLKVKRTKRKSAPVVEVQSEIDTIPSTVLRRFYAENFTIKPEKVFYMDDASVKEKVDERYIVVERESDYLFLKRTAAVISVPKE